jgi:hypothetical protein
MKKIKRLERSKGILGKAVPVDKNKTNWEVAEEAEEEQDKDEDENAPLLNFSSKQRDPPKTNYQDYGDVVQRKILGKE